MPTNNAANQSIAQYNVQTGAALGTLNNVSPSTAGFVLTSNGPAAQPTFQATALATDFTHVFLLGGM